MRLEELWLRDARMCHLCLDEVELAEASRDHVIPKSVYRDNSAENLKLAHQLCNNLRSNRRINYYSPEEYRAHRLKSRPYKAPRVRSRRSKVSFEVSRPDWDWQIMGRKKCGWCGGQNDASEEICAHCFHYS